MKPHEVLEREWAEWNSLDPAGMVVCASGTAALHLALEAPCLRVDRFGNPVVVLVPDYAMVACARSVTLAGMIPVFADCLDYNLNLNPGDMARWDYGVAMAVHNYGRSCQMNVISQEARSRGAALIVEDLSEAHGLLPHPQTDAACWSFYRNKIIHGEEGGAVWFRNHDWAARARSLRSLGFTEEHDYRHIPRGHNYRLSDCHAELILSSLRDGHKNLDSRRRVEAWYDEFIPAEWKQPRRDFPWVYDLRIRGVGTAQQDMLVRGLREQAIEARHGFKPLSWQPEYATEDASVWNPQALLASREVIYLPLYPEMGREDTRRIMREVTKIWESLPR